MSTKKSQNSLPALATLGVYLGLLVASASAQSNLAAKDCYSLQEKVRGSEAVYLWFNQRTIGEYGVAIESVLVKYSETNYPDLSLTWGSVSDDRPYRKVDFAGYLLPDPEDNGYIDGNVLMLANGLPNRGFQFKASQNDGGYEFRFEARSIPYDDPLVRFLYSNGLRSIQCGSSLSLRDTIYKNTDIRVEKHKLSFSTRLTRKELARLRDIGAL